MKTINDIITNVKGAVLLLGPPGTRKTTLLTQIPGNYILECDNNLRGVAEYIQRHKLSTNFTYDVPHLGDDGKPVPRHQRYTRFADLMNAALNGESSAVSVDSLTTLVDYALDEVRRQQGRKIADGIKTFIDEPLQIQDWGAFGALMKHLIITAKASQKLVIFTGHTVTKEDELAKYLKTFIAVPGQLSETIAGYFDEVWLSSIVERRGPGGLTYETVLRTVPGLRQEALGLKTSRDLGNEFPMDFAKINTALRVA